MTTDEAREAADLIVETYNLAYRDDVPVVRAEREAILAVHAAGVVEGIRRAREAVEEELPHLDISEASADTLRDVVGALSERLTT